MAADGRIIIDTSINQDGFVEGSKDLEAHARRLADSLESFRNKAKIAVQKQVDSFSKLNAQYAQQARKVEELKQKVNEYSKQKLPTQEYLEIQKQIDSTQSRLDNLMQKQEKFLEMGGNINSKEYKSTQHDIDELSKTIEYAKGELKDLEDSGKAFTFGSNTESAQQDIRKLAQEEAKLDDINNRLESSYKSLKQKISEYQKEVVKTDGGQKKASKSGEKLNKSLKDTDKFSRSANMSMGKMLATSVLFSFVFRAISGIMNGAKEGMDNLAQYSEETNSTLSVLKSSLTQLKNAFATAFSPILTAVAPAINYLIRLLTAAATAVAQLGAILTGKNTFVKATKVNEDYAASLKDTGGAASQAGKDAKKALAPFDDLVQIQQQGTESSGGTGGGGQEIPPSEMFEEVSVSNNLVQALESIKQKALEVYGIFKKGFTIGFVDTSALTTIQSSLQSIKQSVSSIFNDPEVQNAGQVWANKIIYSLGLVAGSVGSIGATIAANITGGIALYLQESTGLIKQYLINMFDISGDIALIGAQFAAAVATIFSVFSEENGQVFTANIIGIFLNSFMQLTELAAKAGRDILDAVTGPIIENLELFRTALDGLLGIAGDILGTLNELVTDTFAKMNQVYDEHIKPLFDSFKIGFTEIYQAALNAFNTYILPAFEKAAKKFDEFKDQYLQPLIDKFLDFAGRVIDVVRVVWEEQLQPFITWAIETFAPIIGQAIDLIVDKFFAFQETASVVMGIVIDVLNILMEFIKGSFTGDWESAWSNIKDIFKDIWNGIVSLAEKAINFIIDSLNKISFDVPEWVAGIGGEHFGFEIEPVHLPRLATGTVIPPRAGEFAAILGDNRRETEVVSPLSTMKQALLEAIAEAGVLGTGGTTITLRFEGSMGALARVLKPELDREAARKGVNLVIVGGR